MEAKTFASRISHQVILTIVIFILLAISSTSSAICNNSTIPTTNSTNTNFINTPIPSNSTQTNIYENTTIPSNSTQTFRTYIKTSCNSTTYPSICYQSLYPYAFKIEANPMKLCNVSLSLALKAAQSASSTITELLKSNNNLTGKAEQVVQDCFGNVKDSIEQLQDSLDAMGHLDDIDREFQISNVKTWVSAAITNDQTCYDEFDEMGVDASVRDRIRKSVLNVARMTSNALYFINSNIY